MSETTEATKKPAKSLPTPEGVYGELVKNATAYLGHEHDALLQKAYEFGAHHHRLQKRKTGEMYITHPLEVANILTTLRVDINSLVVAILHDTVEDTDATLEDLRAEFGEEVADMVDGLTKISKIKFRSSQEKLAENFRKMVLAMAKDLRVILIKLADRLHNMRTIFDMPEMKKMRIAQETLDIYAPLANRLGVYNVKSELEDLCLRALKPNVYAEIKSNIASKKDQRERYIIEVKEKITSELDRFEFRNAQVYGRPKHFYSIYKKMVDRKLAFTDIHDLFAFRIIVGSIKDCYEALGIVHAMWKPMPGRFKDYIAMPKANMYQSLHTTVIRPDGEPAEIQIRTREMHDICEYGVAAHWSYKESKSAKQGQDMEKFSWLRQIVDWQKELKDPDDFLEAVKVDLFQEEIFVFTPRGDVIQLPEGASGLDFAFAVHTQVGLKATGVKVNGKIAPLRKKLQSGDIAEVITSNTQTPTKDWLGFTKTSKARNKIRSFLRSEQRDNSRKIGRDLLTAELSKRDLDFEKMIDRGEIEILVKTAREGSLDNVLIAVGYGKISVIDLVEKAFPSPQHEGSLADVDEEELTQKRPAPRSSGTGNSITVSGLDGILVKFAKCCNPLPGESIIGFVTRGKGVTIHKCDCARALDLDPARKVDVSWASGDGDSSGYSAFITVHSSDKTGVLANITNAISQCGANIAKAQIGVDQNNVGVLDFEITVRSHQKLVEVINRIENIRDVIGVERNRYYKPKAKKTD